jgi:hypothetical protein
MQSGFAPASDLLSENHANPDPRRYDFPIKINWMDKL